jgi:alpha-tubulin suppressor-like RCC1 family protein
MGHQPVSPHSLLCEELSLTRIRNAHLGHGDSDDRAYPEHVVLRPAPSAGTSDSTPLAARLVPLRVRAVALSKLHTVVLTAERRANVRACGFGSGGRLGGPAHTQYALAPLAGLAAEPLLAAALGQDHTLVLSRAGEVFSWGLNRFAQLGYALDPPAGAGAGGTGAGKQEEPIQAAPKRVQGPLRNAVVRGVAACKTASACWTAEQVFTWGTNSGQLGACLQLYVCTEAGC